MIRRNLIIPAPADHRRIAAQEQHERLCATCGRVHAPDAHFCSNCGASLSAFDAFFGEENTFDEETILTPTMSAEASTVPAPAAVGYADLPPLNVAQRQHRSSSVLADPSACGLLSFFFPGAGQMLAGQWIKGVFLITLAWIAVRGFHLGPFELLMLAGRVLCAVDAAGIARRRQKGRAVTEWDWAVGNKPETR